MTIPRRHRRANQPARQPKEPASSTQENIERHRPSYSPARTDQVSRQQLREFEKQLFNRPLVELAAKLGGDTRLARTWLLIETRYADSELRLDLAARESGVSRDHLNEILRRSIGLTFHQTLIRYRLLKAITIMRAQNCTALDVALDVGFGSVSAFERTFKTGSWNGAQAVPRRVAPQVKNPDFCRDFRLDSVFIFERQFVRRTPAGLWF